MLDQDKKKEEIVQEARRLERRYMSHGCMWRSIPDSWTTKWWKDELAKIAGKTDEK
jgi:HEPN domain-containing protein